MSRERRKISGLLADVIRNDYRLSTWFGSRTLSSEQRQEWAVRWRREVRNERAAYGEIERLTNQLFGSGQRRIEND